MSIAKNLLDKVSEAKVAPQTLNSKDDKLVLEMVDYLKNNSKVVSDEKGRRTNTKQYRYNLRQRFFDVTVYADESVDLRADVADIEYLIHLAK